MASEASELEITQVQAEIDGVKVEIEEAKRKIDEERKAGNDGSVQLWLKEKELLREKENKLRDEKARLQQSADNVEVRFKQKLKQAGLSNPKDEIVTRCMTTNLNRVIALALKSTPADDARLFYEDCTFKIGSRTFGAWTSQADISVNGCWMDHRPTLLTAVHLKTGRLHVLKVLPRHSEMYKRSAQGEVRAFERLNLDEVDEDGPLVQMEHVQIRLDKDSAHAVGVADSAFAGAYDAMKMRRFAASLEQLPQLSPELIAKGGRRMLEALQIMHSKGLIHCDVKAANVLVTEAGTWHLGDFGVSVDLNDRVWGCTHQWYPDDDVLFKKARPEFDFGMLLVMLAVEVDKKKLGRGLLADVNGVPKAKLELVRETCKHVKDLGLCALLQELASLAGYNNLVA